MTIDDALSAADSYAFAVWLHGDSEDPGNVSNSALRTAIETLVAETRREAIRECAHITENIYANDAPVYLIGKGFADNILKLLEQP